MTDDEELAELKEKTNKGARVDEETLDEMALFRSRVHEVLEEIDGGERQKTVSVWDGPLAAFMAALEDTEDLEAVGTALQRKIGTDEDPDALERSEVLRLALRLGFNEAAPEYLNAAREAVHEHNTPDL